MKYCGFGCQKSCGYPRMRIRSSDTPLVLIAFNLNKKGGKTEETGTLSRESWFSINRCYKIVVEARYADFQKRKRIGGFSFNCEFYVFILTFQVIQKKFIMGVISK